MRYGSWPDGAGAGRRAVFGSAIVGSSSQETNSDDFRAQPPLARAIEDVLLGDHHSVLAALPGQTRTLTQSLQRVTSLPALLT